MTLAAEKSIQFSVWPIALGMIHIWRPWKLSNFQDPPPPCPSGSKILPHPWFCTSNFRQPSPSPNDNQSIKRKHNPMMTIICYQVLPSFRSAFVFSINPLILYYGFLLTSFHLAEASLLYFLLRGFTLLCVLLSENLKKCLLFIIFRFANNLFYLHNLRR